jgi:hypothetical protein|nr:hypothetical protein [uncultured Albidiferax sp.]
MIATPFSLAGHSASSTAPRAASPAPVQHAAQSGKKPFAWFAAVNRASLWFSQSRTTWATAGHTLN